MRIVSCRLEDVCVLVAVTPRVRWLHSEVLLSGGGQLDPVRVAATSADARIAHKEIPLLDRLVFYTR